MVYNFSYNPQLDILVFEFFVAALAALASLSKEKAEQIAAASRLRTARFSCVARMALQSCKFSVCINGSLRGEEPLSYLWT